MKTMSLPLIKKNYYSKRKLLWLQNSSWIGGAKIKEQRIWAVDGVKNAIKILSVERTIKIPIKYNRSLIPLTYIHSYISIKYFSFFYIPIQRLQNKSNSSWTFVPATSNKMHFKWHTSLKPTYFLSPTQMAIKYRTKWLQSD